MCFFLQVDDLSCDGKLLIELRDATLEATHLVIARIAFRRRTSSLRLESRFAMCPKLLSP